MILTISKATRHFIQSDRRSARGRGEVRGRPGRSRPGIFSHLFLACSLLVLATSPLVGQSGHDLFQQALIKERAEGDLEAAIALYQRIVREHADHRSLAARALVQIGQCYEKLGKIEARKVYQEVLRGYADQEEQVALAQTRLDALARPSRAIDPSAVVVRRIWSRLGIESLGSPSPDGRSFTFADPLTGDLAIRDLTTGNNRRLTNDGDKWGSEEEVGHSRFSPDGTWVAYQWWTPEGDELRIARVDGSGSRVLYSKKQSRPVIPHAWLPDGSAIVTLLGDARSALRVALIEVADGSVHVLKNLDWRWPRNMALSPDGRYLALDMPTREGSHQRDIHVMTIEGEQEAPLLTHPADDFHPLWSPDGNGILFLSDRAGSAGLWFMTVRDGRLLEAPVLVKGDIGAITPTGFTTSGDFYYWLETRQHDIYTTAYVPTRGKIAASPELAIQRFVGQNTSPEFSPDGKNLAYISQRTSLPFGSGSKVVVIHSLQTGNERVLDPKIEIADRDFDLRWSPHGRSIVVSGYDEQRRQGFYQLDIDSGNVVPLVQGVSGEDYEELVLSPDGKKALYDHDDEKVQACRLMKRDLETNEEVELVREPWASSQINTLTISPDSREVAFVYRDLDDDSFAIRVLSADGGEARELVRLHFPHHISGYTGLVWTPDGNHILFGRGTIAPGKRLPVEVWRVPVRGGNAESTDLAMPGLRDLSMHPDGRRLAFTAGRNEFEVWVMENFLPKMETLN